MVGLATAWRCAEAGHAVTLFERNTCGSGCSGYSLGGLVPYTPTRQHPIAQFQRESLALYPQFAADLLVQTGQHIGYQRAGRLQLLSTIGKRESAAHDLTLNPAQGKLLTQPEAKTQFPHVNIPEHGAFLCHDAAYVDVSATLTALKQACLNQGVTLRENTPTSVADIEPDFDRIIVSAGIWSDDALAAHATEKTATTPMVGHGLELKLPKQTFNHMVRMGEIYAIPHADGRVLIGSDTMQPETSADWLPNQHIVESILTAAQTMLPCLKQAEINKIWRAPRPKSSDRAQPIRHLGDKIILATGHYKIGFCLTPKIAADLAAEFS